MSRTYKKVLGYKDRNPFMKNYANRRLRRLSVEKTHANGKAYKKHTCSYDICDWSWFYFNDRDLIENAKWEHEHYPERYKSFEQCFKKEIARLRNK